MAWATLWLPRCDLIQRQKRLLEIAREFVSAKTDGATRLGNAARVACAVVLRVFSRSEQLCGIHDSNHLTSQYTVPYPRCKVSCHTIRGEKCETSHTSTGRLVILLYVVGTCENDKRMIKEQYLGSSKCSCSENESYSACATLWARLDSLDPI